MATGRATETHADLDSQHNFTHQRNQWRRFYVDLAGGNTRTIRIHHCLSHHIYPNASLDVEIPMFVSMFGFKFFPQEEKSTNPMVVDMIKYNTQVGIGVIFSRTHYRRDSSCKHQTKEKN